MKTERNYHTVFFLPPIEGHVEQMTLLAERLQANVFGLQYTQKCRFGTIHQYAIYFEKHIRQIKASGPYFLCGYSFGSMLLFEIASIL